MRKVTLVLLFSLLVFACKKNEGPSRDTATASSTVTDTAVSTSEPNTTPSSTTVASATTEKQTAASASTTVPSTVSVTDTSTPFDFGPPPPDTAPKSVKYDYVVDTLYRWSSDTQKIVIARAGYGAHFFNFANRSKLEAWRKAQGYEKIRSFDVPGAPSPLPNPFINADRVVIVYRKAR
ncbi:MAG: hypothetical protein QOI24_2984 [Acidobacteriota bacterium]|jgi:hypothetical protein|nr:hypothetical protein [Acidobacteriota bacterium]